MIPLRDDNPTHIKPIVTVALIAFTTLVFIWQLSLGRDGAELAVLRLGLIPAVLFDKVQLSAEIAGVPPWATVLTSIFLHGGLIHLAGNMLYLWIFGNNVEDAMGHARFLVFYLVCGVAAGLGQAVIAPESRVPMIGASGAISGVLGAYLLLYPHARVLVLVPLGFFSQVLELSALWVLGFWFVLQLLNSALASGAPGGVAWFAHIGGFIAGMILIPLFKQRDVRLFRPARHRVSSRRC